MNYTRYLFLLFILCLTVTWFSCKETLENLTQFNMDYNSEVVIPSTIGISVPLEIVTPEVTTNSSTTFESNNTKKELVEKIILKSMTLQITNPQSQNFDFLNEIRIAITADGLDDVEIAYKEDIAEDVGSTLEMVVSGADVQEYIKKDEFSLKVTTTTDKIVTQDITVNVASVFFVDAKILGF